MSSIGFILFYFRDIEAGSRRVLSVYLASLRQITASRYVVVVPAVNLTLSLPVYFLGLDRQSFPF